MFISVSDSCMCPELWCEINPSVLLRQLLGVEAICIFRHVINLYYREHNSFSAVEAHLNKLRQYIPTIIYIYIQNWFLFKPFLGWNHGSQRQFYSCCNLVLLAVKQITYYLWEISFSSLIFTRNFTVRKTWYLSKIINTSKGNRAPNMLCF